MKIERNKEKEKTIRVHDLSSSWPNMEGAGFLFSLPDHHVGANKEGTQIFIASVMLRF
jgi:hypothetical protein